MIRFFSSARLSIAFGLTLALACGAFADTLRLKDGSIIKGRITTFGGGRFTIAIGEGARQRRMTFDASEVESIQFDGQPVETASARKIDTPARKDPEYVDTSAPVKTAPRVITTDITTGTQAKTAPPKQTPPAIEPVRAGAKPVEVVVKVLADNSANGWTNSGWVIKKGQKIRIVGDGKISLGRGKSTGPSGLYDLDDDGKLLKSVPTGALIAVIGDDNNEFIYVGSERTFVATRDGALFLGVNEGNLDDNSGSFDVRVEIEPA